MNEKSNIQVFVRSRPRSSSEEALGVPECVDTNSENCLLTVQKMGRRGAVLRSEQGSVHTYTFDGVFGSGFSQRLVYEQSTMSAVDDFVSGANVTVFAYGATGSG